MAALVILCGHQVNTSCAGRIFTGSPRGTFTFTDCLFGFSDVQEGTSVKRGMWALTAAVSAVVTMGATLTGVGLASESHGDLRLTTVPTANSKSDGYSPASKLAPGRRVDDDARPARLEHVADQASDPRPVQPVK